jgi:ATP/maltotriose-dependent transcriptional regulator MalT
MASPAMQGVDPDGTRKRLLALEEDARQRGDDTVRLIVQVSRAELALHGGNIESATDLLAAVSEALSVADPADLRARTSITRARCLCWAGRRQEAVELLDEAEDRLAGSRPVTRYTAELVIGRALAQWSDGFRAAVPEALLAELEGLVLTPRIEVEALRTALVMGIGGARVSARLAELAAAMQSPVADCAAAHAAADESDDGEALLEVAMRYATLGMALEATVAAGEASRHFARTGGDDALARNAAAFGRAQAATCPGAHLLAGLLPSDMPQLTAREDEVASLAAGGRTNREIADLLVVSVRTVESTLQRAYGKLGVRSRQDIGRYFPRVDQVRRSLR